MVPKLHKRGQSFRGAAKYLFHDKDRATTSERVAWSEVVNCWTERPSDAWFEMWDTWRERTALKKASGLAPGGRDNTTPVLHLTLSWHPEEAPSREQMKLAALSALKAIGLDDHQAVLVAHNDEPQPHVHILANTVHRYSGQTAGLTYSKEALSRWAEDYEREHGPIRCEERVKNNDRRRTLKEERAAEKAQRQKDRAEGRAEAAKKPFEPVKDKSPTRPEWVAKEEIVARMKELRAEINAEQKEERDVLWSEHKAQLDTLDDATKRKLKGVRERVRGDYKTTWTAIYRAHKTELRHLKKVATHPFERAAYLFTNRQRLAIDGKGPSLREMAHIIVSGERFMERIADVHERERKALASQQHTEQKAAGEKVWVAHREQLNALKARQGDERAALKAHHKLEQGNVTFAQAKEDILARRGPAEPEASRSDAFRDVPRPEPSRGPERPFKRAEEPSRAAAARESDGKGEGRSDGGDSRQGQWSRPSPAPERPFKRAPEPERKSEPKPQQKAEPRPDRAPPEDARRAQRPQAEQAPPATARPSRAEEFNRRAAELEKWQKRNRGRGDFDRER